MAAQTRRWLVQLAGLACMAFYHTCGYAWLSTRVQKQVAAAPTLGTHVRRCGYASKVRWICGEIDAAWNSHASAQGRPLKVDKPDNCNVFEYGNSADYLTARNWQEKRTFRTLR